MLGGLLGGSGGARRDEQYLNGAFFLTSAQGVGDSDAVDATSTEGEFGRPARLGPCAMALPARIGPPIQERLAAIRAALPKIDVNFVPASVNAGEKRLLICDMDSTIIGCECIDEIADFVGVKPEVAAITEQAMRGEIDFEDALRARVALLEGLPVAELEQVYAERVRLNPGAETLVKTMAARGAATALVSGGFTFFAERVARAAGFAEAQANGLIDRDGRLTGKVTEPILGREAKREALQRICGAIGAKPSDAVAVGDGANDLAMIGEAGLGVAYKAKPVVAEAADAAIQHSDLSAILHLQGLSADSFHNPVS